MENTFRDCPFDNCTANVRWRYSRYTTMVLKLYGWAKSSGSSSLMNVFFLGFFWGFFFLWAGGDSIGRVFGTGAAFGPAGQSVGGAGDGPADGRSGVVVDDGAVVDAADVHGRPGAVLPPDVLRVAADQRLHRRQRGHAQPLRTGASTVSLFSFFLFFFLCLFVFVFVFKKMKLIDHCSFYQVLLRFTSLIKFQLLSFNLILLDYTELLGFTSCYQVLMGFTVFFSFLSGFHWVNWILPSFTGFYQVLLGFTEFYWVFLGFTGFLKFLFRFTGFDCVLLGFDEFQPLLPV